MAVMTNRIAARRAGMLAPLVALALAGCGGVVVPPQSASFTPATPPPATPQAAAPRFAGLIGAEARALIRLFGEPRLDIRDPAVRKLQFSDGQCVLDAYLYPPRERREPVATYAEARRSDGEAMNWEDCATRLARR
jgi:hypothetical protein